VRLREKRRNKAKAHRLRAQRRRREAAVWKQLEAMEERLDNNEWQLSLFGRWLQIGRHLDMAEKQLEVFGRELEIVARRIEIWRQLNIAEKQLGILRRELEIVGRRIEIWRQLAMAETQLGLVGTQLEALKRPLPTMHRSMKQATAQRQRTRSHATSPLSSTSNLLARWLDTKDISEREEFWLKNRDNYPLSSLPLILVVYLRRSANPDVCYCVSKSKANIDSI
jgi:hypothetical protein